jgi:hypothetical protein
MGKKGRAFTFVTRHDLPKLRELIRRQKIAPHWIGKDPLKETKALSKGKTTPKKKTYRHHRKKKASTIHRDK